MVFFHSADSAILRHVEQFFLQNEYTIKETKKVLLYKPKHFCTGSSRSIDTLIKFALDSANIIQ
jgi:hypothetical protein